jgi:hypothetical protein
MVSELPCPSTGKKIKGIKNIPRPIASRCLLQKVGSVILLFSQDFIFNLYFFLYSKWEERNEFD